MKYSSSTGQYVPTESEQKDADIAEDDLQSIRNMKRDLVSRFDDMRRFARHDLHMIARDTRFDDIEVAAEQVFDDLWNDDWQRLAEISGSAACPAAIPTFAALRMEMARERMLQDNRRRKTLTNPASLAAIGEAL